jgi:hypothetical protein
VTLAALLLAAGLPWAPADTAAVQGRVTADPGGDPLAGALVELVTVSGRRLTVADSAGAYRFVLPAGAGGEARLRASRLGHRTLEVEVRLPARGLLAVDLALPLRPLPVPGIVARVTPTGPGDGDAGAAPLPSPVVSRILEAGSGLAGMAAARPSEPGTPPPTDPADVLYVRGSPADLKLVLLDGAPVYSPFHLGGLLDAFEPEVIGEGRLYVGGAPARYDGGLSYVLALTTRDPGDRTRMSGSADLLGVRAMVETAPGERLRLLAAGRAVHALGPTALFGEPFPYGYGDALLRADADLGGAGRLSLTGFHNREAVRPGGPGEDGPGWGNDALSLRHRVTLRETVLETGVSAGAFVALLPPRGERGEERGENRRARATVDASRPLARGTLRTGAAYDRIDLRHHLQTGGVSARTETSGESAGAYLDLSWLPVPRLALRGGLRGDFFATAGEARLAPRISATWRIGDRAELVGALGRYHQYVRELPGRTETGERALPAPGSAQLEVGGATHVTAGLHQEMDAGIRLGMEAYYKSFDAAAARLVEANASGVDLWVRRDEGAVRGWLGYSLVWNWTAGAGPDAAFVGRQILNAGARFSPAAAVELEGRLSYGAGLPFTGILLHASPDATAPGERRQVRALAASAAEEPMVGPPSDAFLRLDVTASRPFDARIAGRTHNLTPYLRVMNALDRRDASFYFADDPHAPARPIAELPILPVAGLSWRF